MPPRISVGALVSWKRSRRLAWARRIEPYPCADQLGRAESPLLAQACSIAEGRNNPLTAPIVQPPPRLCRWPRAVCVAEGHAAFPSILRSRASIFQRVRLRDRAWRCSWSRLPAGPTSQDSPSSPDSENESGRLTAIPGKTPDFVYEFAFCQSLLIRPTEALPYPLRGFAQASVELHGKRVWTHTEILGNLLLGVTFHYPDRNLSRFRIHQVHYFLQ